jgi:RimJ/RimL family protein N-acetyltransferase
VNEALLGLRLRTPRLELRLPRGDDVRELYRVAARGIHPPELLPFGVAWTDSLNEPDFVAFHETALAEWTPESWDANFVVLAEGRIVGTQSLHGLEWKEKREVGSGSWLGQEFQRRGYGTEMRAAVLELAFNGLGARAAQTGALWHNRASQRVTEKLGYKKVGESTVSPRGEPVLHYDYRLEREAWRPPFRIELHGLETCLPLFGVAPRSP